MRRRTDPTREAHVPPPKPDAKNLTFAEAVEAMARGATVRRRFWKPVVTGLRMPAHAPDPARAFAVMDGAYGVSKWTPYFSDFQATDWYVVEP